MNLDFVFPEWDHFCDKAPIRLDFRDDRRFIVKNEYNRAEVDVFFVIRDGALDCARTLAAASDNEQARQKTRRSGSTKKGIHEVPGRECRTLRCPRSIAAVAA